MVEWGFHECEVIASTECHVASPAPSARIASTSAVVARAVDSKTAGFEVPSNATRRWSTARSGAVSTLCLPMTVISMAPSCCRQRSPAARSLPDRGSRPSAILDG